MKSTTTGGPERLRAEMVDRVKASGYARYDEVENAMRVVPRHAFVPNAGLADAYADIAVITKRDATGTPLSCASVPNVVALMLDQLVVQDGQRILEIGAGTGYNAALLDHLVGPSGQITTLDIDPEVTAQAERALAANGHSRVRVITRDGARGAPEYGPYDGIIVTVGAWDIPEEWFDQLAHGGRLVVPLRWRGQTRSVAFVHDGQTLRSAESCLCGFVPMIGQDSERTGNLDPAQHVALYWDADQNIDLTHLRDVLTAPKHTLWSGATVGPYDPFDGIWLKLTATESGTCRIAAEQAAITSGLCAPAIPARSPALVERHSLAYLAVRRLEGDGRRSELGAIGHGLNGQHLAERLCEHIRAWDSDRMALPSVVAHRRSAPLAEPHNGIVIHKQHARLAISEK
ncbi:hypothetical protein GCM10023321_27270 [Pseudonocardia eucalypti]|uniref:Protein-L-isoaspartate O-methyltransferase n=1 Tax=Pseudonocardia eucalypti TaxID=648755 RepID=A0ABP9Q6I5_9PSEU|nr:protein-L-isoaspartate(D-aspartate) O-methyltransferase [Pseudonocardia eucalypti]